MSITLYDATKRLMRYVLITTDGVLPLELSDIPALLQHEEDMQAMEDAYREYEFNNAQKDYDKMMLGDLHE